MDRKILVTGGAGFTGSNFVGYWTEKYKNDHVCILDLLTYAGNLENLRDVRSVNVRFEKADILDTSEVTDMMEQRGINTVVHFAAESHVDRSIEAPAVFLTTNIIGTPSLLKATRTAWAAMGLAGHFHQVSTIDIVNLICKSIDEKFCREPALKPKYEACPTAKERNSAELIEFVKDRAGHDFRYAIDTTKITSELGYKPTVTFVEGIEKTIDWYIENEAWWNNVLDGSYRNIHSLQSKLAQ